MPSVLIIDDGSLFRRRIAASVSSLGYVAVQADGPEAALRICEAEPPDMILSELVVGGTSGLDLCDSIRRLHPAKYVHVVMMSYETSLGDLIRTIAEGADDFIVKPFGDGALGGRLEVGRRQMEMRREAADRTDRLERSVDRLQRLNDDIERDLVEARKLQMSLNPDGGFIFPQGRVDFLLQPSGHVGGDMVGRIVGADPMVGIFSINVSGHGISAALICARIASWFRGDSPQSNVTLMETAEGEVVVKPLDRICRDLNDLWMTTFQTEHYLTACMALFDPATGEGSFVQAGHPNPIVIGAGGTIEVLGDKDLPIGLLDLADYAPVDFRLRPKDRLLIYSEGLVDCPVAGGELLGADGLAEILVRVGDIDAAHLLDALRLEVTRLSAGAEMERDISAVLLEYDAPDHA